MRLGQPATTLSGGEAQRIKLASELAKVATGRTLYILDEPTTGLHFADIQKLLEVLQRLVDAGNSVVVIEHNLDVIKTADRIIDMGPEGGEEGGTLMATGTPEEIAAVESSYTGRFLRDLTRPVAEAAARKRAPREGRHRGLSAPAPWSGAARWRRVARSRRARAGRAGHAPAAEPRRASSRAMRRPPRRQVTRRRYARLCWHAAPPSPAPARGVGARDWPADATSAQPRSRSAPRRRLAHDRARRRARRARSAAATAKAAL